MVNTGFGGTESVRQLAVRSDGKIVATGTAGNDVLWSRYMPTAPMVGVTSSHTSTDEGKSDASLTFWRDQALSFPTRVYYKLGGTANLGTDYSGPTTTGPVVSPNGFVAPGGGSGAIETLGYIDIPAGKLEATVTIKALADDKSEGNETVTATVRADGNYKLNTNSTKTISIHNIDAMHVNFQPTTKHLASIQRYSSETVGQWTGHSDGLFSDQQLDDATI